MKDYIDREKCSHFLDSNSDDYELEGLDSHRKEIRRKLEERMERRRLKHELEDYEGEMEDDFNWDDHT